MKHRKSYAMASLAILTVALMFTASALPLAFLAEEETVDELAAVIDDGTDEAIRWWLRVLPVTAPLMGIRDYFHLDSSRFDVSAGSDNVVKEFARNIDAQRSAEQLYNLLMLASNLVENDRQTWKLTNSYLNRASEISAGILWDENEIYDPDKILRYGGVYDAISTGNLNTSDILDQGISVSADLKSKWNATNYGGPLNIKLIWDGGNTGNATSTLYADFCTLAMATEDEYVVYLAQSSGEYASSTNSTVWAYTHNGSITPIGGGVVTPLTKGANDVSDLASGFYKLSPGTYGGPFMNSTSAEACKTAGIMGIVCDERYGYVSSAGDGISIFWNGTTVTSNTLDFEITGSDTVQTSAGSPFELVRTYSDYYGQLTELLYEASQAGQTMWSIAKAAHSSNIMLSPSSIIPHLSNVGITAEQSYAMYVLALDQLAQYNAVYGDDLKTGMMKVSSQSLDLYCHGSIHASDGTVIAENVIFSPYVYLKDWVIDRGEKATFNQNGIIMIWDVAASAHNWTMPTDTSGYESIIVEKGAYIVANEIFHGGESVQSILLEVDEIQRLAVFDAIDFGRDDAPHVLEASTLIMIIVLELGLIIALLGYIARMPGLIAIGGIVALIGFFASGWIAQFLLGRI